MPRERLPRQTPTQTGTDSQARKKASGAQIAGSSQSPAAADEHDAAEASLKDRRIAAWLAARPENPHEPASLFLCAATTRALTGEARAARTERALRTRLSAQDESPMTAAADLDTGATFIALRER